MKEETIENLAYKLNRNKTTNRPGAIVFMGAGCSVSAGIPVTSEIVDYVRGEYNSNPKVQALSSGSSYAALMDCLDPCDRKDLFNYYVSKSRVNVSHIYLAQLVELGYVDYIVTVNFDNLAQRALALFNNFPPIYDISILKDFTTTTLETKSIICLHGQHNGLWQLNTKEEMKKVIDDGTVSRVFHQIANNRLWVMVGYSGEDLIFEELMKLGRFDNGLYWIGYEDKDPKDHVKQQLKAGQNKQSFLIRGFDSDSFFLKLNAKLGLENATPPIFDKPFSFLSKLQEGIVDLEEVEDFKVVKDRFEDSKRWVQDAIIRYERAGRAMTGKAIKLTQQRNELINYIINDKYDEFEVLSKKLDEQERTELSAIQAVGYYNWGTNLAKLAGGKVGRAADKLYRQAFEKYEQAIALNPDDAQAYNNWGTHLAKLAQTKAGKEADDLYRQAFGNYKRAVALKPDYQQVYNNWGNGLAKLAETKAGAEADDLYRQAFEKYEQAIVLDPYDQGVYNNWGNGLAELAETKIGAEAGELYRQSFEKYEQATTLNPDDQDAYCNWGIGLANFAKTKAGGEADELYRQAFEKYEQAIALDPDDQNAYCNWGIGLANFAKTKTGIETESLFRQAFEKLQKSVQLGGRSYNLACLYAYTGQREDAFHWLRKALAKHEITFDYVDHDEDWAASRNEPEYNRLKEQYTTQ